MNTYIGVDPGATGAAAWLDSDGQAQYATFGKLTERDIWLTFAGLEGDSVAVLERVASSPQMGVRSSFSFGRSYGFLRACLIGAGIPFVEKTPVTWQTKMSCRSKGDKNVTKGRAQQLFPELKITHGNADALLIASYCRRHAKEIF